MMAGPALPTLPTLEDLATGEACVAALRAAARARGISVGSFIRPLTHNPGKWLYQLERAAVPMRGTRARIRALIADEPIPPPLRRKPVSVQAPPQMAPAHIVRSIAADLDADRARQAERLLAEQSRPCFRCGVRADVGCRHRPWTLEHATKSTIGATRAAEG